MRTITRPRDLRSRRHRRASYISAPTEEQAQDPHARNMPGIYVSNQRPGPAADDRCAPRGHSWHATSRYSWTGIND